MTFEAAEAIILLSALSKEQTWQLIEQTTELDYDEFLEIWDKRVTVQ